jgi:hypothetical protein
VSTPTPLLALQVGPPESAALSAAESAGRPLRRACHALRFRRPGAKPATRGATPGQRTLAPVPWTALGGGRQSRTDGQCSPAADARGSTDGIECNSFQTILGECRSRPTSELSARSQMRSPRSGRDRLIERNDIRPNSATHFAHAQIGGIVHVLASCARRSATVHCPTGICR